MKEIDNIVKKVLLESLNEKADEITNKIKGKMEEAECTEGDCGETKEGRFKDALKNAYKRKHPEEKFPASLRKKYFSDDEEDDDDNETDVMSGEFDYVAEVDCMEGDCGKMEESMARGEGEKLMDKHRRGVLDKLLSLYPNSEHLKDQTGIKGNKDKKGEVKEKLHGKQSKIDVASPKGKITKADFDKLRSMKKENMNEKWEGDTKVEKTGEYSDMSVAQLDKMIKALKSKTAKMQDEDKKVPKSMREKMSELYFAKRAKQGWKAKGSAKVNEEMDEGNAFTGALANAKKEGKDKFTVDGKEYDVKNESFVYSINFAGENLQLTENELITIIEEIVLEEKKGNLKPTIKSKGMAEYDRIHKKDEDINKKSNEETFKKMKDYVKAGSKGNFETNPKHFPKGNGQLAKMDKKAYTASDAVEEYIDTFAYGGGMLDLDPDEIGYNEDWLEKTIEGSAMTGNSPEYANAEDTGYGKKLNKRRKENLYNQEKRQGSYKRVKQPVDVAGENTKSGKLNKMFKNLGESEEEQKNILSEEMNRMKQMIGYNKNTQ